MAAQIRALASFGDDPDKVEVVLPAETYGQCCLRSLRNLSSRSTAWGSGTATRMMFWRGSLLGQRIPSWRPRCPTVFTSRIASTEVSVPGIQAASVVLRKVWTDLVESPSEADFYAADRITYHNPTEPRTPTFPEKPELGSVPRCRGVNIERDRDTSGVYRYTKARVFFNTDCPPAITENHDEFARAEQEALTHAIQVVNRLIDVYRLRTGSDYIQRLPGIHVTDLFFRAHNVGSHGASFGHGIRSAVMNRSETEMRDIAALLASGAELPVQDLLMLDAGAQREPAGASRCWVREQSESEVP